MTGRVYAQVFRTLLLSIVVYYLVLDIINTTMGN